MEGKKLRTAAYCRVSTPSDTQDGSYEIQCEYFEKYIRNHPGMDFVGVYGDHGKSGRYRKGRTGLNRLIQECEEGWVDLILTKSISRFSRNLQEFVEIIRHLKELNVVVRFEKEGLDTDTMNGELMLGILATVAQEVSNSISQNITWSRRKHLERGQPWDKARYGFVSVGKEHKWEVVEHEAQVVRKAFHMAGMCHTYSEISEQLTHMEEEHGNAKVWKNPSVVSLLRSEKYIGNYLSNRGCTIVDRQGVPRWVRNTGQVEQILIEGHHEALVSEELYYVVQELLDHRLLASNRTKFSQQDLEIMQRARRTAAREPAVLTFESTNRTLPVDNLQTCNGVRLWRLERYI
jgi:DNA invertase Pin-like site-specific DNA recombinase